MEAIEARKTPGTSLGTTFGVLAIPPLLFLAATTGFVVFMISRGTKPEEIAGATQDAATWILLTVQLLLLGLVIVLSRTAGGLGWKNPARGFYPEFALGAGLGGALGLAYVFALAPAMVWLQARFGDYVPPGAVLSTVGMSVSVFFVANVLLAPFLEEALYRSWATSRLLPRLGVVPTALIICVAFGLFHWAGGFWYVLLVGFVAGGLFMALRLLRDNLVAPFAAHLTLNLVEFVYVAAGGGGSG